MIVRTNSSCLSRVAIKLVCLQTLLSVETFWCFTRKFMWSCAIVFKVYSFIKFTTWQIIWFLVRSSCRPNVFTPSYKLVHLPILEPLIAFLKSLALFLPLPYFYPYPYPISTLAPSLSFKSPLINFFGKLFSLLWFSFPLNQIFI